MPTKLSQLPVLQKPERKQVITVSVAGVVVRQLDMLADRANRSRSALVEIALREYTDAHRRGRKRVAA